MPGSRRTQKQCWTLSCDSMSGFQLGSIDSTHRLIMSVERNARIANASKHGIWLERFKGCPRPDSHRSSERGQGYAPSKKFRHEKEIAGPVLRVYARFETFRKSEKGYGACGRTGQRCSQMPANGAFKKTYLSRRGILSWKTFPHLEVWRIQRVPDIQLRPRTS